MIGLLLMAAAATTVPSTPTLAQWAAQDADSRRIALVGTVEGVLLATSAVNGASLPVNTNCFNTQTPEAIEQTLLDMARKSPSLPLVQGVIGLPQCGQEASR